jgi:hypothetical protein
MEAAASPAPRLQPRTSPASSVQRHAPVIVNVRRQETIMINPRPGPRSGDDTYDLIDDALFKLAEHRGAWLGDDLTAITLIASLIDQAERFLPDLVTTARLNSHTWDEIARALATSPLEARLRFDPESPIADTRWPHDL